jgi:Tfp pilus assembly protein PilN
MKAVNLLPPDIRGATKDTAPIAAPPAGRGGAGPFLVLGVLAALVVGVAAYVLTGNALASRKAELAEANARQAAIQGTVAKLKPYADYDAMAKARINTVRDLAGSRFDWEQVLRDLARAVPADVTLKSLSGSVSTDTGGSAGSSLRGAITAPAVTLQGCAPGQTEVARLMARLHDVDGVTRVSLSKSEKQLATASGGGGGSSAAEVRNAAPCGSGLRPNFEVVAFFEKSKAATTAAPATGGATATATATPTATPTATATPATGAQADAGTTASSATPGGSPR